MKIYLKETVSDKIVENFKTLFANVTKTGEQNIVLKKESSIKSILIESGLLTSTECLIQDDFQWLLTIQSLYAQDTISAVILTVSIADSVDIEFIVSENKIDVIAKDSKYWRSYYDFNKRELHQNNVIFKNIPPDIICYMAYGKEIKELFMLSADKTLMDIYQEDSEDFKNIMLVKEMIRI